MTKPMLVIQGATDTRVVKEESDQIVAKLKDLDRDVEYLVLEDEGYGFSKKENEIKVYQYMLVFLEKHQSYLLLIRWPVHIQVCLIFIRDIMLNFRNFGGKVMEMDIKKMHENPPYGIIAILF